MRISPLTCIRPNSILACGGAWLPYEVVASRRSCSRFCCYSSQRAIPEAWGLKPEPQSETWGRAHVGLEKSGVLGARSRLIHSDVQSVCSIKKNSPQNSRKEQSTEQQREQSTEQQKRTVHRTAEKNSPQNSRENSPQNSRERERERGSQNEKGKNKYFKNVTRFSWTTASHLQLTKLCICTHTHTRAYQQTHLRTLFTHGADVRGWQLKIALLNQTFLLSIDWRYFRFVPTPWRSHLINSKYQAYEAQIFSLSASRNFCGHRRYLVSMTFLPCLSHSSNHARETIMPLSCAIWRYCTCACMCVCV